MKIVAISDTHCEHNKLNIPKCDILIHAGDYSSRGTAKEIKDFYFWLNEQSAKYKVSILGNHEVGWQNDPDRMLSIANEMCPDVIHLYNSSVTIDGIKIYGSPGKWAYMADRGHDIRQYWKAIPNDVDILVTHGPPQFILDKCTNGNVGCADLADEVLHRIKPRYHLFGHIHGAFGKVNVGGIEFRNVSICDGAHFPTNPPTIIEYSHSVQS